jgi:hypothetical protein
MEVRTLPCSLQGEMTYNLLIWCIRRTLIWGQMRQAEVADQSTTEVEDVITDDAKSARRLEFLELAIMNDILI